MKEITKFVCEVCCTEYDSYSEAVICEKNHIQKEDITISSLGYIPNKRLPCRVTLKLNNTLCDYFSLDYFYTPEKEE